MSVIYFTGELPQGDPEGDQKDLFVRLHLLSRQKSHTILRSFLDSATTVLKEEERRLPSSQRRLLPCFESVLDLTDHVVHLRETSLGPAIERVLAIVFQLGCFIAYYEERPLDYNFNEANTSLIGKGTGLLSAVAVGLCPTLSTLPRAAEDVIRVAFRFGLVVDEACRCVEPCIGAINTDGAWVCCCFGASEQEVDKAVSGFNAENAYSDTTKACVFSADAKCVNIGGPPSTLSRLSRSGCLENIKTVYMKKIQGMWHNESLYAPHFISQTMQGITDKLVMRLPLFSPVTGHPFASTDSATLLEQVMHEILQETVRWDRAVAGVTRRLKQLAPPSLQLVTVQKSHHVESLVSHWQSELIAAAVSTQDLQTAVMQMELNSRPSSAQASKIAVVGMACRFPDGADDPEKFWKLLAEGRDVHRTVPSDRFDARTHVDPTGKARNTSKTPYGCFVKEPGLFDALFFGMSPREAEQTDPMHRLALLTAYEALESSGYVTGRGVHPRRVGTFFGQASDDYREVNSGQDIGTYFIPGGCRAFAPGRINYVFGFWGPSYSIDTACSSSLAAIQTACTSLWSADVDMAIAGGVNILTNSDVYAGLSAGHFLSPTGGCKTWDETADGYCRADGVGSIVLKRLEDAEADNDNIIAVILAAATNHSAGAVSITHPDAAAQSMLFTQVARRAGICPLDVGYAEMHGTGTQAGDYMEMKSVTSVFAPVQKRQNPLYIGSAKANFGHGEAAAGIISFIKTLLVLQRGIVPRHIGIKTRLNPALPADLEKRMVVIPDESITWQSSRKRLALINNFGAAGGNTSMIMEEAPSRPRESEDTRSVHIIPVSAKTPYSLQENMRRLIAYIRDESSPALADIAYTLSARRAHNQYRFSVTAGSRREAVDQLQAQIDTSVVPAPVPSSGRQVAFVFAGQGVMYTGIGRELYRESPLFRQTLTHLDFLARRQHFSTFLPLIEGSIEPSRLSICSVHLAITCVQIALVRLWASFGVTPDIVIGHSLGEYAALVAAGVISESSAIQLVGERASLLIQKCEAKAYGMLAVFASADMVSNSISHVSYEIACRNGPNETVIGGPEGNMDLIASQLSDRAVKTARLDVAHAYHTSQMDTLVDDFIHECRAVVFKKPRIPVISPLYKAVIDSPSVSYLASATRGTVDFCGALHAALKEETLSLSTIWLEIGHHPICSRYIMRALQEPVVCASLHRDGKDWSNVSKSLCDLYMAGVEVDWGEFHRPFEQALRLVGVPTYAWDSRNYWLSYRGDWNLTKGHDDTTVRSDFRTSSIHRILKEEFTECKAEISAETNITDAALRDIIDGHAMNGHGVASSFLHADMAFTLASWIRRQKQYPTGINIVDFEYHEPVVKLVNTSQPQPILVTASAAKGPQAAIQWRNPASQESYCRCAVLYEDPSAWLCDWERSAKLVSSRINTLYEMAASGVADKLTRTLAYSLFGKLVKYSDMYQNMQSVILFEDEATAEVLIPSTTGGDWEVPPHFLDSVVSLSGFVLNGGTYFDNYANFFITPSWKSLRFAQPLLPGERYKTYVRMVPSGTNVFVGDVYVLHGGKIIGVVEAILFRQWPRVMLNRFFMPADAVIKPAVPTSSFDSSPRLTPHSGASDTPTTPRSVESEILTGPQLSLDVTSRALSVIASELGIEAAILVDDAKVADMGIDSLMSLVLAQRLREELGLEIRDAFFLEVVTIADLKKLFK